MANNQRYEFRIAGFGGQGVVTIGRILGTAFSVYENKNSVNTQSYGPESRGGACKSEVVVSDGIINYPYVRNADVLIALSQVALDTYLDNLKKGGILVVDPSSVRTVPNPDNYKVYRVPTIEIANGLGNVKYQNAVALGTLSALIPKLIAESSICRALAENVPPQTRPANLSAFEKGMSYIAENYAETD